MTLLRQTDLPIHNKKNPITLCTQTVYYLKYAMEPRAHEKTRCRRPPPALSTALLRGNGLSFVFSLVRSPKSRRYVSIPLISERKKPKPRIKQLFDAEFSPLQWSVLAVTALPGWQLRGTRETHGSRHAESRRVTAVTRPGGTSTDRTQTVDSAGRREG